MQLRCNVLQIGAYDCRHSAQALARACKQLAHPNQILHIWVYEEAPAVLARHMLLLSVLLDTDIPVRQRTELFLELHNNAIIQETTAEYLGRSSASDCLILRLFMTIIAVPGST